MAGAGSAQVQPEAPPAVPLQADAPPPPPPSEVAPPVQRRPARQRDGAPQRVPASVELVRDVVFATVTGDDGSPIELKMDAAFPKQSEGHSLPAIIYIHGGGWQAGSREMGLRQTIGLAMGGYFACTIDYRLLGQAKAPAAVYDCKAAVRFLRTNAQELGVDPQRIGVWGHSAGGHLAALLATTGDTDVLDGDVEPRGASSAVQCAVAISAPSDLARNIDNETAEGLVSQWLGGALAERRELARKVSPVTHVDAKDPPILLIHGDNDELVPVRQSQSFHQVLKDAGVTCELMVVQGAGHSILQPRAMLRAAQFLDEHLGGHAGENLRALVGPGAQRQAGDGLGEAPADAPPRRRRAVQPGSASDSVGQ